MINQLSPSYVDRRFTGMAITSMILGIAGLVLGCCVYPAFVFGSLAIIFSTISRGGESKRSGFAIAGMILGIISIVFGIIVFIYGLVTLLVQFGGLDGYWNYINELMNEMYPGYFDLYNTL